FWRDLGLPGLVDIHTHFMPPNVLAKVWAFFEGGHAGAGRAWPIAYRLPEEERVALLRAFGVHRFSALLYPHKPDMAAWLNSWAAPGAFTGPGPISEVLARHPRLTMIVAHLGAPEYGEFLDLAGRYRGVHLDTTMTFTGFLERLAPFPAALLPRLAGTADRIL